MTITKADVERLAGQLDAWQSLVGSRYECPAAAQSMSEAAIMLTELWAEVERLREENARMAIELSGVCKADNTFRSLFPLVKPSAKDTPA